MAEETMMTGQTNTETVEGDQGQGDGAFDQVTQQKTDDSTSTPEAGEGGEATDAEGDQQESAEAEGEEGSQEDGEAEGPPEKYEWKAPEGFEGELDQSAIDQFEPVARELGLTQEQADKLVEMHANSIQRGQEAARENWTQQVEQWQTELREDPEFGKDFDANLKSAQKAVKDFGDPALLEALEETGMGNHPALVRTFAAIGKAISEDKIVMGNQSQGPRAPEDVFYPQKK